MLLAWQAHCLARSPLTRPPYRSTHSRIDDLRLHAQSLAETLVQFLSGESRQLRRSAVKLIQLLIASTGQQIMLRHIPSVISLLQSDDWGLRAVALETLKLVPDLEISQSWLSPIIAMLQAEDWGLRAVALEALALLNCSALVTVAARLLDQLRKRDVELHWEVTPYLDRVAK